MTIYELIDHYDGESIGYFSTYEKAERIRDEVIRDSISDEAFSEAEINRIVDSAKDNFSIYAHTVQ